MSSPTDPTPQVDASQYSNTWVGGDTPENPPHPITLDFQVQNRGLARGPAQGHFKYRGGVTCTIPLIPVFKLWKFTPFSQINVKGKPIKVFSCSTDKSRVVTPTLLFTEQIIGDQTKPINPLFKSDSVTYGPYIESIKVEMWFDDRRALLNTFVPGTDVSTGESTQTVSYGFNFGFFGADATAGISAEYSNSHSINLTDFEMLARSANNQTDQTIALAMKGNGDRYANPDSIKPGPTGTLPPVVLPQDTLPKRAFGDFPFSFEGLWELPGELNDTLDFHIRVTVVCPVITDWTMMIDPSVSSLSLSEGYTETSRYRDGVKFVRHYVEKVNLALAEELEPGSEDPTS